MWALSAGRQLAAVEFRCGVGRCCVWASSVGWRLAVVEFRCGVGRRRMQAFDDELISGAGVVIWRAADLLSLGYTRSVFLDRSAIWAFAFIRGDLHGWEPGCVC